jgi:hypothetical protein
MSALRKLRYDDVWDSAQHASFGGSALFSPAVTEPVRIQRPLVSSPTTVVEPEWLAITIERVAALWNMPKNWDERGSAAVRSDVLMFAMSVLEQVMPPGAPAPSIVPLGHGGVQLLWSAPAGELELEIRQPNEVLAYLLDRRTGNESEWALTTELSNLANILWSWFRH